MNELQFWLTYTGAAVWVLAACLIVVYLIKGGLKLLRRYEDWLFMVPTRTDDKKNVNGEMRSVDAGLPWLGQWTDGYTPHGDASAPLPKPPRGGTAESPGLPWLNNEPGVYIPFPGCDDDFHDDLCDCKPIASAEDVVKELRGLVDDLNELKTIKNKLYEEALAEERGRRVDSIAEDDLCLCYDPFTPNPRDCDCAVDGYAKDMCDCFPPSLAGRSCGSCGVVHDIPGSNCADDRERKSSLNEVMRNANIENVKIDSSMTCEELAKATPDQTLLGRAICAVARHAKPPMFPPCANCMDFAGVILTQMGKGPEASKPAAHDWDLDVVLGYCKKCHMSYLNPLASEPCDQRKVPACQVCNDTGFERTSASFADGTPYEGLRRICNCTFNPAYPSFRKTW